MQTQVPSTSQQGKREDALLPFVRAWRLEGCQLYWLPIAATPMPFRQKQWLVEFARMFLPVAKKFKAAPETFLQMKVIQPDLRDEFIRSSRTLAPLIGLSRRPGEALPPLPDKAYADDLAKGNIAYDPGSLQPDYCYWFTGGSQNEVLEKFLGSGGITSIYLSAGTAEKPPAMEIPAAAYRNPQMAQLLTTQSLHTVNRISTAVGSPFLKQSKQLFAEDLKDQPQYPGLLYVLPLLCAGDFFNATTNDMDAWFSLFDMYLGESPRDKGVLLATRHDVEADLVTLLRTMQAEGHRYAY